MNNINWYWNLTFFFSSIVVEIYDVGETTIVEDVVIFFLYLLYHQKITIYRNHL